MMNTFFSDILAQTCRASSDVLQVSAQELRVELTEVSYDSSRDSLEFSLVMNFIIPYDLYDRMLKQVAEDLPFARQIQCHTLYREITSDMATIIRLYMPYIVNTVSDIGSLVHTIDLDYMKTEGKKVIFGVVGEMAERQLNRNMAPAMAGILREKFGLQVEIVFCNIEQKYDARRKNKIGRAHV